MINTTEIKVWELELIENVRAALPGLKVEIRDVEKNGETKRAILISEPGSKISPTIYLDGALKLITVDKAAEKIVALYKAAKVENDAFDPGNFTEWNRAKEIIVPRLVNKKANEKLLKEVPNKEFLDLAVIFVALVSINGKRGSITVRNEHMKAWGVTVDELEKVAIENAPRLLPVNNPDLLNILKEASLISSEEEEEIMANPGFTIVTNTDKTFGAATILYEGVLESLSKMMGGDFYVIPSSVHEVLTLPAEDGMSITEMNLMVQEVNATQVPPQEVLADHVYFYNAEDKELKVA